MNEEEIKEKLTSEEYVVLREKGTEAPFSGEYVHTKDEGVYKCKVCGNVLFDSVTKFDSGTGWPSFYDARPGSVTFNEDTTHGLQGTEVICSICQSHLGHVFDDGPSEKTGKRYCINSVCLDFDTNSSE